MEYPEVVHPIVFDRAFDFLLALGDTRNSAKAWNLSYSSVGSKVTGVGKVIDGSVRATRSCVSAAVVVLSYKS